METVFAYDNVETHARSAQMFDDWFLWYDARRASCHHDWRTAPAVAPRVTVRVEDDDVPCYALMLWT